MPSRHLLNLGIILIVIFYGYIFTTASSINDAIIPLIIMTGLAFLFGMHLVLAIGGADMPVVV